MTKYPKYDDVKIGEALIPDSGFACLEAGKPYIVAIDEGGKFIECSHGQHYLDGQVNTRDELVGLSKAPPPDPSAPGGLMDMEAGG